MPRIVYGILDAHRSHRIEIPDAVRDAAAGRPNACTLCHLDRPNEWAGAQLARWSGEAEPALRARVDGAPNVLPDSVASLLAGDPVTRLVYARAMGRGDAALSPAAKGFLRVHLAIALGDAYPSIRRMAQRSLVALERELPIGAAADDFDHLAEFAERRDRVGVLLARIAAACARRLSPPLDHSLLGVDHRPDLQAIGPLLDAQASRAISIGE